MHEIIGLTIILLGTITFFGFLPTEPINFIAMALGWATAEAFKKII